MKLVSRLALLVFLAGVLPAPHASYARQAGPDTPHIVYSSYLGTSNFDGVADVAVAPDGSIVLVLVSQPDSTVMRLGADGKTMLGKRTIHGGSAEALALGSDGAIYVVGQAREGLLETVRPFQASAKGLLQGFVAKVSADAKQLLFCSYLGGSRSDGVTQDIANDVAVDDAGLMYVVGKTQGSNNDFPVVNPTQATYGGGYSDGFVSIVDANAGSLVFSTYYGEQDDDTLTSCSVDLRDQTFSTVGYVLPGSDSRGGDTFPCPVALEEVAKWEHELGENDADILRVKKYCTDNPKGRIDSVLVDDISDAGLLVSAVRLENEYPGNGKSVSEGGNRPQGTVSSNIRISVYDDQLELLRTRVFGGPAAEYPGRLVVDGVRGIIYVIGESDGVGLQTINAFQPTYGGGGSDCFVAAFDLATLQPVFSSYIGGSKDDYPNSIALDAEGNILLAGFTDSADFPLTADAAQPRIVGLTDGFLTKVSALGDLVPDFGITVDPATVTAARGDSGTITVNIARTGGFDGKVTVTAPDTKALKVKLTPASTSTNGDSVTVKYKVKKKATLGAHDLVFTARDENGRERTATLSLTIQ